jgi:acylphosphatase
VQNLPDGTVEALIQGTPDQIDRMLEWMRRGPPAAVVTDLDAQRQFTDKRYGRFEQI